MWSDGRPRPSALRTRRTCGQMVLVAEAAGLFEAHRLTPGSCGGHMNAHLTGVNRDLWPELPPAAWEDTYHTLHMWSQIVGKVRLYVNSVGLTTSPIPYASGVFEVQFNFIQHQLLIQTSHATSKTLALK